MLSAFNSLNDLMYSLSAHAPLGLLYILLRNSTKSLTIPLKNTLPLSLIIIELSLLMIFKMSINLTVFEFTSYVYIHVYYTMIKHGNNGFLYYEITQFV